MGSCERQGETKAVSRSLSFCKDCGKHTPHEWREGDGVVAKICLACIERDAYCALDRD